MLRGETHRSGGQRWVTPGADSSRLLPGGSEQTGLKVSHDVTELFEHLKNQGITVAIL